MRFENKNDISQEKMENETDLIFEKLRVVIKNKPRIFNESFSFENEIRVSQKSEPQILNTIAIRIHSVHRWTRSKILWGCFSFPEGVEWGWG